MKKKALRWGLWGAAIAATVVGCRVRGYGRPGMANAADDEQQQGMAVNVTCNDACTRVLACRKVDAVPERNACVAECEAVHAAPATIARLSQTHCGDAAKIAAPALPEPHIQSGTCTLPLAQDADSSVGELLASTRWCALGVRNGATERTRLTFAPTGAALRETGLMPGYRTMFGAPEVQTQVSAALGCWRLSRVHLAVAPTPGAEFQPVALAVHRRGEEVTIRADDLELTPCP